MRSSSTARGLALRGLGYAFLFVAIYLLALWRFFPYPQLARNIEARLRSEGLAAQVEGLGPGLFPGLRARRVAVAPIGGAWGPIDLDDVQVRVPPAHWIRGERRVDFGAGVFGGRVTGGYLLRAKRALRGSWKGIDLRRARLPAPLADLPLAGTVSGNADIQVEPGKLNEISGLMDTSFAKAGLGGGKVFGFSLPEVALGDGKVRISAQEGKVEVEGLTFEDGDLGVDFKGNLLLREDLSRSLISGILSLRPNEKIERELGVLFAVFPGSKASDGRYTARVRGSLDSPRLLRR